MWLLLSFVKIFFLTLASETEGSTESLPTSMLVLFSVPIVDSFSYIQSSLIQQIFIEVESLPYIMLGSKSEIVIKNTLSLPFWKFYSNSEQTVGVKRSGKASLRE